MSRIANLTTEFYCVRCGNFIEDSQYRYWSNYCDPCRLAVDSVRSMSVNRSLVDVDLDSLHCVQFDDPCVKGRVSCSSVELMKSMSIGDCLRLIHNDCSCNTYGRSNHVSCTLVTFNTRSKKSCSGRWLVQHVAEHDAVVTRLE